MMICSGSPSGISSQVMNITSEVTVYMFVQRRTTSQWPSIAAIATMSGSEAASDATKKTGDSDSESTAVTVEIKVRSLKKAVKQAMKKKRPRKHESQRRIRRAKDPIRKRAIVDPAINDPEQFLLREHAPRHLRGPDHHQGSVGLKHFEITVVSSI